MSWREPSVRGFARDKVGLVGTEVSSFHLLGAARKTGGLTTREEKRLSM
jgi:hypothetical protein